MSRAGDITGDGVPDFMISNADNTTSPTTHQVLVYNGATFTIVRTHTGPTNYGKSIASVGDYNLDGVPDYAVGAPQEVATPPTGVVRIYSGTTGAQIGVLRGDSLGYVVGDTVTNLGDINNDGVNDIATRAYKSNGYREFIFSSLNTSGPLYQLSLSPYVANFGLSAAGGSDLNLDGTPDLLLGSPSFGGLDLLRIYSLLPVGVSPFGTGTPGCSGIQHITGDSVPSIGNSLFKIRGRNAAPLSTTLLIAADMPDVPGSDSFGIGVTFHVDLIQATEILTFDGQANTPGYSTAPAPIPNNPLLQGKTYTLQELDYWASGPCTPSPLLLSSSRGLNVTIQ